jgi:hypothetical protein
MIQSTFRPRSNLLIAAAVAAAAAIGIMGFGAVRFRARVVRGNAPGNQGVVAVSLALAGDRTPSYVAYVVKSSNGVLLKAGSVAVKDPKAPLAVELTLPPGKGDTLTVFTSTSENGRTAEWTLGSRQLDVVAGQTARVDLGTVSVGTTAGDTPSSPRGLPGGIGAGDGAKGAGAHGLDAAAGTDAASSCQACEFATEQGKCDREFLSARSEDPPSWGCATLGTPREQTACAALLHCMNAASCGQGGQSPFVGCFCGAAPVQACQAGVGISGDCVAEYTEAAESASGPPKGSPVADLARYLTTVATNPRTPVGLADNIRECANLAHCDSCNTL